MGLKNAFRKAAVAGFGAAGDVVEDANYYVVPSTRYDPTEGVASVEARQYMVSGIFTKFSADKIDDDKVLPNDVKMLVPQLLFTPSRPNQHDFLRRVEFEASVEYGVVNFEQDPAGALWIVQLRKA